MIKVLFVCTQNSARSQMAEAYLNYLGGDSFEAQSAGLEPGTLNPLAIEVMKEKGIDISKNATKDVFEFYKQGKLFQYVITVCDKEAAERCPVFPGVTKRLHWSFEDPASFTGTTEEKLIDTRRVREEIRKAVLKFMADVMNGKYNEEQKK